MLLRSFGWAGQDLRRACLAVAPRAKAGKMPVDGAPKTLSRVRNLV